MVEPRRRVRRSHRDSWPIIARGEPSVKVLVYPPAMEIGGSQLNALEIAAAVRDRGHEVTVVSRPGPLLKSVRRLGLSPVPLDPPPRRVPSPHAAAPLTRLSPGSGGDIVHGYEGPPPVEALPRPTPHPPLPPLCPLLSIPL